MIIGFNTGSLRNNFPRVSKKSIVFLKSVGCNAIELSLEDMNSIDDLGDLSRADFKGFKHKSLHAPRKEWLTPKNIVKTLEALEYHQKRLGFDVMVFHPVDIENFVLLQKYDIPIAFENMDHRKEDYRTVQHMKRFFKKYNYPMVFDAQHAYVNDFTGKIAKDLLKNFRGRIVEVHLSAYDKTLWHTGFLGKDQSHIIKAVPKDIPIILEGGVPKTKTIVEFKKNLKKELEYIKKNLDN